MSKWFFEPLNKAGEKMIEMFSASSCTYQIITEDRVVEQITNENTLGTIYQRLKLMQNDNTGTTTGN